jgi:hypothetical protein
MPFGGTSTGSSSSNSPYAAPLGAMGQDQWSIAKPMMQQLGSQFLEAMRTGGVNSFLPWITRALDASRSSASQGLQDTRQNLARTGEGASSFGQQELDTAKTSAGDQANQIPSQMIMDFLKGAPSFAMGTSKLASGNLAAAGSMDSTTNTSQTPSFWQQFIQTAGIGSSAAASAFGGGGTP